MQRVARSTNPLPTGTATVFVGLLATGVLTYVYLGIARRSLDETAYSAFAVVWGVTFIVGPGLFQPLEQAIGHSTATRDASGQGSKPLVSRAALLGLAGLVVVSLAALATWPLGLDELLSDEPMLLVALLCCFGGFMALSVVRGVLGGHKLFPVYARTLGTEGAARLVGGIALAIAATTGAASFGFVMALSFLAAAGVGLLGNHRLLEDGPPARWDDLSPAVGLLLIMSLSEAFLLNIGPAAVAAISDDDTAPGTFLSALVIARLPLFAFQAVKVSLLPAVTTYAALGEIAKVRTTLIRLLKFTAALGGAAVLGSAIAGPFFVELFFVDIVSRLDVTLLAAANAVAMLVIALSVTLIGLNRSRKAAICWVFGVVIFVAILATPFTTVLVVEIAMLVAFCAVLVTMAVSLRPVWSAGGVRGSRLDNSGPRSDRTVRHRRR
jgi:O-antigen/teichoic acid export membrane protein